MNYIKFTMLDDNVQTFKYNQPLHLVKDIPYGTIKQITIGDDLRLYGMIIQNMNGKIVSKYLHLGPGDYNIEPPALFKTMHINNIGSI